MSKFRAEKEDDMAGKLPVLKDGTVDCTRLLLHFGVDDSTPLNPMLHPGGAGAFPFADPGSPPPPGTAPQATGENPQAASSNLPLAQTRDAMLNSNSEDFSVAVQSQEHLVDELSSDIIDRTYRR
ncbi:hypothetical protein FOZ60_012497 [Perkinsus olseni]|uniref:Uncharacterized protein n=1 Tax=Perkinsus olseni TaxID=32597 RepID=A0A7J6P9F3_PEROL|nr:hypothetical protein FOZ60_012497 [Perkinsus olseni]